MHSKRCRCCKEKRRLVACQSGAVWSSGKVGVCSEALEGEPPDLPRGVQSVGFDSRRTLWFELGDSVRLWLSFVGRGFHTMRKHVLCLVKPWFRQEILGMRCLCCDTRVNHVSVDSFAARLLLADAFDGLGRLRQHRRSGCTHMCGILHIRRLLVFCHLMSFLRQTGFVVRSAWLQRENTFRPQTSSHRCLRASIGSAGPVVTQRGMGLFRARPLCTGC